MKKFLIFYVLLLSTSSYAACPIDIDGESVCSLSNFNSNNSPIFQSPNSERNMSSSLNKFSQQNQKNNLNNKLNSQNNSIMQYNSGCQFGICVQDLNNTKNKNQ